MSTSSLDKLPVELLHRILDHVDPETALLSFASVCRYFRTIIHSYNQLKLDFRSMTKRAFHQVRHLIQPNDVTSLTLSNDHRTAGQISLFLSLFDIHAFTRLRSVTLIQINNTNLVVFIAHISTCPLISLSIIKGEHDGSITKIDTFSLLVSCPIRHLTLSQSTPFVDIKNILIYFPCLQTLVLDGFLLTENVQQPVDPIPGLSKLKSLVIHFHSSNHDTVASLLLHTPSLTHLKLSGFTIGYTSLCNGDWWIEFIRKQLPLLQSFQFYLNKRIRQQEVACDIESIIMSFKTPFWIEKRWYVTCDYYQDTRELHLYTIPICKPMIVYKSPTKKISCSNYTNEIPHVMNDVRSLTVNWFPETAGIYDRVSYCCFDPHNFYSSVQNPLFDRVSKLTLFITKNFTNDSIDYLSSLVNLTNVDSVTLNLDLSEESLNGIQTSLSSFFDRARAIQSIQFQSTRSKQLIQYLKIIRCRIPKQVRNVIIELRNENGIDWILDQFENFSSITLQGQGDYVAFSNKITEKLKEKGRVFTCSVNIVYASFWLQNQPLNQ